MSRARYPTGLHRASPQSTARAAVPGRRRWRPPLDPLDRPPPGGGGDASTRAPDPPAALPATGQMWLDGSMRATTLVAASRTRRRWWQLVLLGGLAGIVAGLAIAAVAGDRRSQSAAERLIQATSAPDGLLFLRDTDPELHDQVRARLETDPEVAAVWPVSQFVGRTTDAKDWYYPMAGPADRGDISRPIVVEGRPVADDVVDEVVITQHTAQTTGLGVGDPIAMDLYTPEQMDRIIEDTEVRPAGSHLDLTVVGIVRDSFDIAPGGSDRMM